jgi:hypothetical protein
MPNLIRIHEDEISKIGLLFAGFDEKRQNAASVKTNLNRFRASYGAYPVSCSQIFQDIQGEDIGTVQITKPNVIYLLMTLCWLNNYITEHKLAGMFNV